MMPLLHCLEPLYRIIEDLCGLEHALLAAYVALDNYGDKVFKTANLPHEPILRILQHPQQIVDLHL